MGILLNTPSDIPPWLFKHKVTRNEAAAAAADVRAWTQLYNNSSKFKERYENENKNFEGTVPYDDAKKLIDGKLNNSVIDFVELGKFDYDTSSYSTEDNEHKIIINPKIPYIHPAVTLAHEFSHNAFNKQLSKPVKLVEKIQSMQRSPLNAHDKSERETKADLDAFRYILYKLNIHDASKEDFTEDMLNKAKKEVPTDFEFERLKRLYSDEDLIWLMNNVAYNKNKDNTVIS